jgi:hypothetical protein
VRLLQHREYRDGTQHRKYRDGSQHREYRDGDIEDRVAGFGLWL